jgi:Leucine-rich repeat (LRR) protein
MQLRNIVIIAITLMVLNDIHLLSRSIMELRPEERVIVRGGFFSRQPVTLDLRSKDITSLVGLGEIARDVERLNIIGNNLDFISAGELNNLTNLTELTLSQNHLKGLHKDAFKGLVKLKKLFLHGNELSELHEDLFEDLVALEVLFVNNNRLITLPAGIVRNQRKLRIFLLFSNALRSLPENVLNGLTNLRDLDLRDNGLVELPNFNDLVHLEGLNVGDNQLTHLQPGSLNNLHLLQKLGLYNNQLSTLPDGIFNSLRSLKLLDLTRNSLSKLQDGIFDRNGALERLYLGRNQLHELPRGIFNSLRHLKELEIANNRLPKEQIDPILERFQGRLNRLVVTPQITLKPNVSPELLATLPDEEKDKECIICREKSFKGEAFPNYMAMCFKKRFEEEAKAKRIPLEKAMQGKLTGHRFHSGCLGSWLNTGASACPECRRDVFTGEAEEAK